MFSPEKSLLLIIDVQGKLVDLVVDSEHLTKHIEALIKTAQMLHIPIIYTEQVPEKIGATVPHLQALLKDDPIPKRTFSCCGEQRFVRALQELKRDQIIVAGIETHVCVYQTVYDLLHQHYQVKLVEDAVAARAQRDHDLAINHAESLGAQLTSTEMIICELIKGADHERFRDIIQFLKQK